MCLLLNDGANIDMNKDKDGIVEGTTCFSEHRKHRVDCNKKQCRHWIDNGGSQNCVLIASDDGPKTLQEIGDFFGVTRMRICQIEKIILKKLSGKKVLSDDLNL